MIRKIALFIFLILTIFVLFALYTNNSEPVNFKFYGGIDKQVLLVVIISISFFVGMVIGALSTYPKKRKLKKQIRHQDKQIASLKTSLVTGNENSSQTS